MTCTVKPLRIAKPEEQGMATTGHMDAVMTEMLCIKHMRDSLYCLDQGSFTAAPLTITGV